METDLLLDLARKYIWWRKPEEAVDSPDRIIVQVMDLGTLEDAQALEDQFGEDRLRRVLAHAEAGQLSPKSWAYWHYRLGVAEPGCVPPLPKRRVA